MCHADTKLFIALPCGCTQLFALSLFCPFCHVIPLQERRRHQAAFDIQRLWQGYRVRKELHTLQGRTDNTTSLVYQAEEHRKAAHNARLEAENRERMALQAERMAREQKVMCCALGYICHFPYFSVGGHCCARGGVVPTYYNPDVFPSSDVPRWSEEKNMSVPVQPIT